MFNHPGLTAVMKMLMKSKELKNPASEPEKEQLAVTEPQNAETAICRLKQLL